jgi:hypothetical protein
MDVDSRIKVLTRRITVYKWSRYQLTSYCVSLLVKTGALFRESEGFHTTKSFNWKYAVCHLYVVYYRFLNDYPMFVYSGLPCTTIRNECTKCVVGWTVKKCPQMIIRNAHSGKELCRHSVKSIRQLNRITRQFSFNSSDGERDGNQSTQDDMIMSYSNVNLNIK